MSSWPDLSGRLERGVHYLPVRVYYEDTDFTGIAYHGSYVRFFERGRSDFLRLAGVHHSELLNGKDDRSLAFAVKKMTLTFSRPATIDDVLEVRTRITNLKGARIELEQKIYRDDVLLVACDIVVAVITLDGRATRLPAELAVKLAQASDLN
ncbi:MAG: YbgC/FadM family acyl-CoA thioesterase [Rhodobacteraceae bacterium]|nr:YbgC/FadM family acyl-CoA thioesterase [Paracoccaceae bacterium]